MALLPYVLSDLLNYPHPSLGVIRAGDLYDQNFGHGLLDDDISIPRHAISAIRRPWRNHDSGVSSIVSNKDEFKVNLDVQQFKPEELKVKVENGFVIVDGEHEERSDQHGFISRKFTRRYKVPEDFNVDALKSNLSSDGVLSLTAPKKISKDNPGRSIPINLTNAPAIKEKKEEKTKK